LVSHVVSDDALIEFSLQLAQKIASMSAPVVALAKEAVNKSFETSLAEGLLLERRLFQTSFAFVRIMRTREMPRLYLKFLTHHCGNHHVPMAAG